jgi:sec-independent protein translocase protein TatA
MLELREPSREHLMSLGPWQLIIIALVILVLFGRGRISEMMGDFGKGIKSFKQGMTDEEAASVTPAKRIEGPPSDAGRTEAQVSDAERTETPRP